jgi:glycosyltransferase involved in cell wall biosynthesis
VRNVLIVFYHFAPLHVSGLQRIIHFLRHLPRAGWRPHVLGVDAATAEEFLPRDPALLARVPEGVRVFRAPRRGVVDAVVRRLPSGTEWPDMQAGWYRPAVRAGRKAAAEVGAEAVLASGSPWTALLAGRAIARQAGLPLVADFRDPWVGNPYAAGGPVRRALDAVAERAVVRAAARVVANTEALRLDFRRRYPAIEGERFACVPNGFDAADLPAAPAPLPGPLVIRHMGGLYARRDPGPFLRALARAFARGDIPTGGVAVEMIGENRTPYADPEVLRGLGLDGAVRFLPPVAHAEALALAASADALLVVQPETALQVPAKLYEAIGLAKPVICLTSGGATAALVREESLGAVVDPGDEAAIADAVVELWRRKQAGALRPAAPAGRSKYDARTRAKALAAVLDEAVGSAAGAGARRMAAACE